MHDVVIRGGVVVDGTGAPPVRADVAISSGRIAKVGSRVGAGHRIVDADGCCVLPGWVDIHTHYDGQAMWDPTLSSSVFHGVTTVVFGNCGVGFAPVRPGAAHDLVSLMKGVEDIPEADLLAGLDFRWESFGDYLDALDAVPHSIDVAAQLGHGPLRLYAMGSRGADPAELPTGEELAAMSGIVERALRDGALGFTTSRTRKHRSGDGAPVPSLLAGATELHAIAAGMAAAGHGVIEVNSDFDPGEFDVLQDMARAAGRPLSILLVQYHSDPGRWLEVLRRVERSNEEGVPAHVQTMCRGIGLIMGLDNSRHPFRLHPAYRAIEHLPLALRAREMRARRDDFVLGAHDYDGGRWTEDAFRRIFVLQDPVDYEPPAESSLAHLADRTGRDVWDVALDLLTADHGRGRLVWFIENFASGDLEPIRTMLLHPYAISGGSDAGAHVASTCDASLPTFLLTHWARDRTRGDGLPLEHVVSMQTQRTATAFGLFDRGVLASGYRADVNVVDHASLHLPAPLLVHDLPAGGCRLLQGARGYRHTFVAGIEVATDGQLTGRLPGRVVRGPQAAPRETGTPQTR